VNFVHNGLGMFHSLNLLEILTYSFKTPSNPRSLERGVGVFKISFKFGYLIFNNAFQFGLGKTAFDPSLHIGQSFLSYKLPF